jgi:MerR family Zn(II)-responsive transcriptional regulator of zntA
VAPGCCRLGLLPEAECTPSGYRLYSNAERDRLAFILQAKSVGLALDYIREILALRDDGQQPCRHVLDLVDRKIDEIQQQMRSLQ